MCFLGPQCRVPLCVSSRQILAHWKQCRTVSPPNGCPVCRPLLQAIAKAKAKEDYRLASDVQGVGPAPEEEESVDASVDQLIGMLEIGDLHYLDRFEPEGQLSLFPEQRQERGEKIMQAMFPFSQVEHLPLENPLIRKLVAEAKRIECKLYRTALNIQEYELLVRARIVKIKRGLQATPQRENLQQEKKMVMPETGRFPHLEGLSPQQRQVQVEKVLRAFNPNLGPNLPLENPRVKTLVAFAKRVEGDAYRKALNIQEYERLVHEKIGKLQRDVQVIIREKRQQEKKKALDSFNRAWSKRKLERAD